MGLAGGEGAGDVKDAFWWGAMAFMVGAATAAVAMAVWAFWREPV